MAPTSFPACSGSTSTPNTVVGCSWSPRSLTDGAFDRLRLVNRCGAKFPRSELDMSHIPGAQLSRRELGTSNLNHIDAEIDGVSMPDPRILLADEVGRLAAVRRYDILDT